MTADEYAFEGYPVSEVKNRYGANPYRLEDYEEKSLQEIRAMLQKLHAYKDVETCEQHLAYLQSLLKKLNLIMATEEREGILNLELRKKSGEIRNCCAQLAQRMEEARNF
ncbi:hypothetical protein HYY74_00295 [Candidatus Woesearchaeota archaeon]|nr:hypothetical protein [Candidatus Woesearchaeota archaeon]